MYYQTDPKLNPIRKWGCYFLCLLRMAEKELNIFISYENVFDIFHNVIILKYMTHTCFVEKPAEIINYVFKMYNSPKKCFYIGHKRNGVAEFWGDYTEKDVTRKIDSLKTKYGYHFIFEDYNPAPKAEKLEDVGDRYFKII